MKKLKNKGFTLVELVAIVVILAAIFLVAFPMILSSSKRAENKKYNIMVDILCDAGKSYIYTSGEDFELNNVGDRTTIFIADLVQNGVVDPETKNPRNDSLVIDDRLLFITNSDKSLSCTFQSLEEIPVPNTRNSCIDNLVYNSNVQYLIKNTNSNVIYTNDRASNAGNHTVTATIDPFSPVIWENRTTDPKTFVCTIARAPLTPTLTCENPKVYDNTRNANCTIGLTNIQGSDTITATATCLYDTKDIGTNKTISCTNITLDGTKSSNYTLTSTSLTTTGVVNNAKLTFNPNGGTLVGTSPLYARKGEAGVFTEIRNSTAGTVPTATKTGQTFNGWYTNTTAIDLVYTSQKQNTSVHRIDIVDGSNGWAMTSSDAGKHIQAKIIVTDSGISNQPTIQFNDIDITPYEVEHTNNTWTFYLDFDITSEMVTDRVYPYSNTYRFIDIEGLSNSSSVTVESLTKDGKKYFDGTGSSVYISDFVSDTTLYAGWDAKRLTIRYNKNDGSGSISSETFVYDGNMDDNYMNPPSGYNTRTGYKFAGWSKVADGSDNIRYPYTDKVGESWFLNQMGDDTTKTVDLYAVWTPNVLTVNFYADGAIYNSSGTPVNELLGTDTLYYNGTVGTSYPTDYADPWGYKLVKAGYSSIGRYRIGSADSSNVIVQDLGETTVIGVANRLGVLSQLESGDVTVNLYAGWTINSNTLTVDPNGGTILFNGANRTSATSVTQNYNTTISVPNPTKGNANSQISSYAVSFDTHGGDAISAITATKTGTYSYTFSSWSNSSNCGSMSGTTYTFPSSNGTTCTKTANWSSTLVSTSGGTITLPTPSRAGYSFTGWYTAESGGTKIGDAGASYTPTDAITLHAQWVSAPTLTYEIYKSDGTTVASTITGTGSVTTAGYRVGSIVKFTCTGTTSNKPQYIKVNGTAVETQSISQNGEVIITKGYTITSPGPATINAECGNQGGGVATSSTGSINYYRIFGLSCQRNGATSIGSCPSQQVLMANSTNASGAGGHAFTLPNITRTDRCGSGCAVIGWSASSATATSATFNKTATVNMCTTGTSGCSETTGSSAVSSGTINLGANYDARSIFAITYGTIPTAPCPTTSYNCEASYTTGTNLVPFNGGDSVRVYNSSTTASATIIAACASNQKVYPKGASVSWNCAPGTASGGAGGTTCNVPIGNWTDWECRNN